MEGNVRSNSTSNFRSTSTNKRRNRDIVSSLPDSILHQILSLLDMKEVVGTSLISKRWRYLWTSVPCLNFNDTLWKRTTAKKTKNVRKNGFINFVDKVLFFRDDSRIIKLGITCDSYCDIVKMDEWMIVAARRRVKEVNLLWDPNEPTEFTHLVFDNPASSIMKMKFRSYHNCHLLQFPNSLCLAPMLKTLHLEFCKLPNGDSKGELTLQCHNLEILTLINCEHGDLKLLDICLPGLVNLVIENVDCSSNGSCKLEICALKLESIILSGCMYQDYSLEYLLSLVSAKFGCCGGCIRAQSLIQVLEGFHYAKSLELFGSSLELQNMEDQLPIALLLLRCLKLTKWSSGSCTRTLLNLLRSSRSIETLVMELNQDDKVEDWEEKLFLNMFLMVKVVEVRNLKGCDNDLKFLELLLKNASQLEKLTITTRSWNRQMKLAELGSRVQSLPRASSSITILLF